MSTRPLATCPVCGGERAVTNAGVMRYHLGPKDDRRRQFRSECAGTGEQPATSPSRITTVRLTDDQIGALNSLLSLVHYDDLAKSWLDMLPAKLIIPSPEQGGTA